MWQSLRISHLFLRLSLAGVFLWFGIDKFFHPEYWLNAWMLEAFANTASTLHISPESLVYGLGVLELLVGISLLSNMFVGLFSLIGAVLLISTASLYGFNEVFIRDISLIGGLMALTFWPNRRFRNY